MRLVESILEAEYRRAAKEKKLLGRSGLKVVKQLAEIEEEHLADLSFLARLYSGRIDDLRRVGLAEEQKKYLLDSVSEAWDALLLVNQKVLRDL
jgi:hypothetical protein